MPVPPLSEGLMRRLPPGWSNRWPSGTGECSDLHRGASIPRSTAEALEATLAELEHRAVEPLGGNIELIAIENLAIQLDAALGEQAPRLGPRHAEVVAHQGRQMHRIVARELRLLDLVRNAPLHEQAVEVLLGASGRALVVVPRHYFAREGAL